ncbi:MAG: hypothetical protein KJ635_02865, partial [Proteobacteria bacterium]|nr:hypothetical protein [Pseudomonadota bacterium]
MLFVFLLPARHRLRLQARRAGKIDGIPSIFNIDGLVKSLKIPFPVIPAKAGIQCFQAVADYLDS